MNNSKFIITSPRLLQGGVASFVKTLKPFFNDEAIVFYRGRSTKSQKKLAWLVSIFLMPIQFIHLLKSNNAEKIIVNSSLSHELMLRDGVLIRLAKRLNRKTLLFVHGFKQEDLKHKKLYPLVIFFLINAIGVAISIKGLEYRLTHPHLPMAYIIAFWWLAQYDYKQLSLRLSPNIIHGWFAVVLALSLIWNLR